MELPRRRPRGPRLSDPGHSELTAEGPHRDTVSNPAVVTSEYKAHIPMGKGTKQECHRTSGHTSKNMGSPAVRAGRQRTLITEERRLPAGSKCHQRADVTKAMGAS